MLYPARYGIREMINYKIIARRTLTSVGSQISAMYIKLDLFCFFLINLRQKFTLIIIL